MGIGERLRQERLKRHLSQEALAEAVGTSPKSISRWEQEQALPQTYYRLRLSRFFGLPLEELFSEIVADKAPAWGVPYPRNLSFTGREQVFTELLSALERSRSASVVALGGLGGVGKTQTAVEFAYRYRQRYQAVLWLRAENEAVLRSDVAACASLLHLMGATEGESERFYIDAVRQWLQEHDSWLLIFDNVEDLSLLEHMRLLPGRGHILITTRHQAVGPWAQFISLEPLDTQEAALLLLRRARVLAAQDTLEKAGSIELLAAVELANQMAGLPLALDQAGAYIEATGCRLSDYLEHYQRRPTALLKRRGETGHDHPDSVFSTFELSFRRLEQEAPAAITLLRLCAFFDPDAIPETLFLQTQDAEDILPSSLGDPLTFDEALAALRRYSLLKRDPEAKTLTLHRLLQAILRKQLSPEEQHTWAEHAVRLLSYRFPVIDIPQHISPCKPYISHALACLAHIDHWRLASPEAGILLMKMGIYACEAANYAEAENLLQQAYKLLRAAYGPEHPDVASALDYLGHLFLNQGKYPLSRDHHQQALALREKLLGPLHPATLESLNNLALAIRMCGDYAQAEKLHRETLARRVQALGPEHLDLVYPLNNLAFLYYRQQRYAEAVPLFERALRLAAGHDNPLSTITQYNLALVYTRLGRFSEAETLYHSAMQVIEEEQGAEHLGMARILHRLSDLYLEMGRYSEAEDYEHRALALYERILGKEHHTTGQSCDILGRVLLKQQRYQEAEFYLQRALAIHRAALGDEHPELVPLLQTCADLLCMTQRESEARQLLEQAEAIQRQHSTEETETHSQPG